MKTAAEIMNRNFFHASPTDSIGSLLQQMAERGLGSVPVLDLAGRPLGVATTGEVAACYDIEELSDQLARPAFCVELSTPVDVAARTLALRQADSLLVVDERGVAVGDLSALELLRAVLGLNGSARDAEFVDAVDGSWRGAALLELGAVHATSDAPGVVMLSPGFDTSGERIVWAEPTLNMRERLDEMLRNPQDDPQLEAMLGVYPRTLVFRCLTMYDPERREELARAMSNVGPIAGTGDSSERVASRAARAPAAHGSGFYAYGAPVKDAQAR